MNISHFKFIILKYFLIILIIINDKTIINCIFVSEINDIIG